MAQDTEAGGVITVFASVFCPFSRMPPAAPPGIVSAVPSLHAARGNPFSGTRQKIIPNALTNDDLKVCQAMNLDPAKFAAQKQSGAPDQTKSEYSDEGDKITVADLNVCQKMNLDPAKFLAQKRSKAREDDGDEHPVSSPVPTQGSAVKRR